MVIEQNIEHMDAQALRELARSLMTKIESQNRELVYRQTKIDQLTQELALNKRWRFGRHSEQLDAAQASLLDEALDGDIAAIEIELDALSAAEKKPSQDRQQPKRAPLPANLPRVEFRHEPSATLCGCGCGCGCQLKRIGEDVSEKLDYTPGVMTVERHIRGKWACTDCKTLTQAPVPPQIIDKGIATSGLLAQVLVAKYGDHLPL